MQLAPLKHTKAPTGILYRPGPYEQCPKPNGEGGIRTPGTSVNQYDGLANRCRESVTDYVQRTYDATDSEFTALVTDLCRKWPDLRDVVEAWPSLPEPVRAGIVAMVKASSKRD